MSDEKNRRREREAKKVMGDTVGTEAVNRDRVRATGPHQSSIFSCCPINDWVLVATGVRFAEVGILRDVFLDEMGRAIAILDETWRLDDEQNGTPTYIRSGGDGIYIPSTSVSMVQRCSDRWASKWKPPTKK